MAEKPNKQSRKTPNNREVTGIIADIHHVSARYVRMVLNGECNNPEILNDALEYLNNKEQFIQSRKSKLIQEVEKTVPFHR